MAGINMGGNLGSDITYSGTVAAAFEGTLSGVPSIAVSLVSRGPFEFAPAAAFSARLVGEVARRGLPEDTLLNVNVPDLPGDRIRGVRVTRQGKSFYGEAIVEKVDPRGRKYFWIGGGDAEWAREGDTDLDAAHEGFISVTPLHLDLTNEAAHQTSRLATGMRRSVGFFEATRHLPRERMVFLGPFAPCGNLRRTEAEP